MPVILPSLTMMAASGQKIQQFRQWMHFSAFQHGRCERHAPVLLSSTAFGSSIIAPHGSSLQLFSFAILAPHFFVRPAHADQVRLDELLLAAPELLAQLVLDCLH